MERVAFVGGAEAVPAASASAGLIWIVHSTSTVSTDDDRQNAPERAGGA
jgi:hypothetical protein